MIRRYAFTWSYLGIYVAVEVVCATLSSHAQDVLSTWASTSVVNLEHDPLATLVVSAFIGQGNDIAWPVLIALALFGANHALGSFRTLLICVAGNVIGSLVSEGIVACRVDAGQLPVADRHYIDVGPSYVVLAAIVVALICGGWLARALAAFDLGILIFIGGIFGGLSTLDVSAVGHLTAALTAAACLTPVLAPAASRSRTSGNRDHREQLRDMAYGEADQVGDARGSRAEQELAQRAAPERPSGQS
jgi:hypothetical protein